ncbi:MAG: hypothetical protein C0483_23565 [Pirellula sp.]|nr:hypothetical protein [Pirellula sp.]
MIVNAMHKRFLTAAVLAWAAAMSGIIGCGGGGPPGLPESQQAIFDEIKQYEGVASFSPEVGIFEVDLTNSKINDAFIAKLAEIPELARLVLTNTPITDACVPSLKKMKKLVSLEVGSAKTIVRTEYQDAGDGKKVKMDTIVPVPLLSPAAVQALRAALPELTISGIEEMETPPENAT